MWTKIEITSDRDLVVAFTADQHVGNHQRFAGPVESGLNLRCRQHLDALGSALKRAVECGAVLHVGLGDLFDTDRPRPQIVGAAQRVLESSGIPSVLLLGNHEFNTSDDRDHALAPLYPVAEVCDRPTLYAVGDRLEIWSIPFLVEGRPANEWLPDILGGLQFKSDPDTFKILALHTGIKDHATPPWLSRSDQAVGVDFVREMMRRFDFRLVIAGDWHEHRRWESSEGVVVQCGALVPTGFDNASGADSYGSLYIVRADGSIEREVIPGPRFFQAARVEELDLPKDGIPYVEISSAFDELESQRAALRRLKEDGVVFDGIVVPNKTDVEVIARSAAASTKQAKTLDEAVSRFVDRMHVRDSLRPQILSRLRGFVV